MNNRVMRFALIVTLAVIPSFADTIYVAADNSNLYTIDPTTGVTSLVGNMGFKMSDIAFLNGAMFGIGYPPSGDSSLYSINSNTGSATKIGATDTGAFLNALVSLNGILYAAGGAPGCGPSPAPACNSLYTLNTASGVAALVGSGSYSSAGDLENGLYLTSLSASSTDQLFTVNPTNGAGSLVGDIGFAYVFGLAFVPATNTLYGFNDIGNNVISINTSTGAGTSVATYSNGFEILGAATQTTVPEPRGTVLMAGLLLAVGWVARRKRKREIRTSL